MEPTEITANKTEASPLAFWHINTFGERLVR
jgi:hypothetical protein